MLGSAASACLTPATILASTSAQSRWKRPSVCRYSVSQRFECCFRSRPPPASAQALAQPWTAARSQGSSSAGRGSTGVRCACSALSISFAAAD